MNFFLLIKWKNLFHIVTLFKYFCYKFQPFDRLNLNESSSDEDEDTDEGESVLHGMLTGTISTDYVTIDSKNPSSTKEEPPIQTPNERKNVSQEQLSQPGRSSKGKSITPKKNRKKSPTNVTPHTPGSSRSSLDSAIPQSSPHKRKSNSPQNYLINPENVRSPKIGKKGPNRYLPMISSQSRQFERTQSTPPRFRRSSRNVAENPLEGTSRSISNPVMVPVEDEPEVAEADSTTSDLPIFPTERIAHSLSESTLSLFDPETKNVDLDALRKYQEEIRALRRLQNMSEIVTDQFVTIDALDPTSDFNRQNQVNSETGSPVNKTKTFKFSYELDGMFNSTNFNKSVAPDNNPDDNNDENASNNPSRGERSSSQSNDPNVNPGDQNRDSHPGPSSEGSNPNQGETSRPPDPADDPGSRMCDEDMADLHNDVYIERPVWHGYSFGTGSYNREGMSIMFFFN